MKLNAIAFIFMASVTNCSAFADQALVTVPGGELHQFWLAPKGVAQRPRPAIKIRAFRSMVYPVSNSEFQKFLRGHPEWRKSRVPPLFAGSGYLSQFRSDVLLNPEAQKHSPVNNVSWFAARAYCEQIGMRLPSTDEWEYIAAASETARDASGDAAFLARILDWYSEPSEGHGLPIVGQRAANIYGIHDLHGLVWEWVDDFNSSMTAGESRQGTTFSRDLFCGGGASYGGNRENYAAYMRFAFRSSLHGKDAVWNLGFRCVKSLEEKS